MQITTRYQLRVLVLVALVVSSLPTYVFAGSQNFTSSGTFTVPSSYLSLTVTVNGAGGGGGGGGGACAITWEWSYDCQFNSNGSAGSAGGTTSFGSSVTVSGAGGGGGGGGMRGTGDWPIPPASSGSSGTASGGDTNTTGAGSAGGGGGAGASPGGNGGGNSASGGTGGGGGQAVKTWASGAGGAPTPGGSITVTIGSGGGGGGGGTGTFGDYASEGPNGSAGSAGSAGSVSITWTLPSSSQNLSINKPVSVIGNVTVTSNITKGSGTFVIDHPVDPADKLLYHSFVESPDALNEYTGTAIIGKNGEVAVHLPDYFEALNRDYQYFIRPIDTPMGGLFIKQEVKDNVFVIAGGTPGGEVSWMVTGIRHDPYILAHPIIPEVEKGPDALVDKGEYLFAGNAPQCSTLFGCVWDFLTRWF